MPGPLSNIRILDMSRVLAGPWAGQLLGDYGADVVKIERPGAGDDTRQWGPPWLDGEAAESAYFLSANRNKRSITVNLAVAAGQQIIRDLAQKSDVLIGGTTPKRMGTAHPNLVPYQAFATNDGNIIVAVGNDRQFVSCCDALGVAELGRDSRFATMADRIENREMLVPLLSAKFLQKSTSNWLELFLDHGVPAGAVNNVADILSNDHAKERNLVREIRSSTDVPVPTVSNPVDFDRTPVEYKKAPPLLGEHTDEVLREWLGYSVAKIETLRQDEVI